MTNILQARPAPLERRRAQCDLSAGHLERSRRSAMDVLVKPDYFIIPKINFSLAGNHQNDLR